MAKRKNDTKYHEVLKQAAGYSYKNGSPAPAGYKVVKSVDNKDILPSHLKSLSSYVPHIAWT